MSKHFGIISGVFVAAIIIVAQCPFFPPFDMDDMRRFIIVSGGIIGLGVCVASGVKFWIAYTFLPFIGLAWVVGMLHWIPGYTVNQLVWLVGYLGIIVLCSNAKPKIVLLAVLIAALLQIVFAYLIKMPWVMTIEDYAGSWGSVRHRMRYGLMMVAGLSALLGLLGNTKVKDIRYSWALIIGFVATIIHCQSNIAMAAALLIICLWLLISGYKQLAFWVFCVGVSLGVMFDPSGFVVNSQRWEWWKIVLQRVSVLGYGPNAWHIIDGPWESTVHPHSIIAEVLFSYGVAGLWAGALCVGVSVFMSRSFGVTVGILGVFACLCTSSFFQYPDGALMFAVFCGLGLGGCHDKSCGLGVLPGLSCCLD